MRKEFLLILCLAASCGCTVKYPPYVTVPWGHYRSKEPVTLPLTAEGRDRLMAFLTHDGMPDAPDPTPDNNAEPHRQVLDALVKSENLAVGVNSQAREFCQLAAALCGQASLFRNQPVVRQVVDARFDEPPSSDPMAVPDGNYWWIFRRSHGQLTEVLLVKSIDRVVTR